MRIKNIAALALCLLALHTGSVNAKTKQTKGTNLLKTKVDSFNYMMGQSYAESLLNQLDQLPVGNKEEILKREAIIQGFMETLNGTNKHNKEEMYKAADKVFKELMDKEDEKAKAAYQKTANEYKAKGYKDLGKPAVMDNYKGPTVLMKVLEEGNGDSIKATDMVYLEYEGRLAANDSIFDSTEGKEPAVLPVNQVIQGFSQALQQMRVGEKATFLIPSELGYGRNQTGPIPANSALRFTVKILRTFHSQQEAIEFMKQQQSEETKQ